MLGHLIVTSQIVIFLDAESVMIFREEYEAHDVAGLLKEYFRELPDPLMTEDAYAHFITASTFH